MFHSIVLLGFFLGIVAGNRNMLVGSSYTNLLCGSQHEFSIIQHPNPLFFRVFQKIKNQPQVDNC